MHLLTEIEEEAKFEQSDEEGDIKRNSDEDKEEIVTGRIASLRCACSTQDKTAIPRCWILLDSQSIVDIFSNKKLILGPNLGSLKARPQSKPHLGSY